VGGIQYKINKLKISVFPYQINIYKEAWNSKGHKFFIILKNELTNANTLRVSFVGTHTNGGKTYGHSFNTDAAKYMTGYLARDRDSKMGVIKYKDHMIFYGPDGIQWKFKDTSKKQL
jgi:hypothetical protein